MVITIVIALVAGWLFGINPMTVLGLLSGGGGAAPAVQQAPVSAGPPGDRGGLFVSTVLRDTLPTTTSIMRDVTICVA